MLKSWASPVPCFYYCCVLTQPRMMFHLLQRITFGLADTLLGLFSTVTIRIIQSHVFDALQTRARHISDQQMDESDIFAESTISASDESGSFVHSKVRSLQELHHRMDPLTLSERMHRNDRIWDWLGLVEPLSDNPFDDPPLLWNGDIEHHLANVDNVIKDWNEGDTKTGQAVTTGHFDRDRSFDIVATWEDPKRKVSDRLRNQLFFDRLDEFEKLMDQQFETLDAILREERYVSVS